MFFIALTPETLHAYNFAKRLKTLKGLTPYEFIKPYWTQKPEVFKLKPTYLNLKSYILLLPLKDTRQKESAGHVAAY